MANKIYTKTTSTGTDDCLIIEPNNAWRLPLEVGDDWTKIHVGLFWSWVPADDDNGDIEISEAIVNGVESDKQYGYIGFTRDTVPMWLPRGSAEWPETDHPDKVFIGLKFNQLNLEHPVLDNQLIQGATFSDSLNGESARPTFMANHNNPWSEATLHAPWAHHGIHPSKLTTYLPPNDSSSGQSNFANYVGFDLEKTTGNPYWPGLGSPEFSDATMKIRCEQDKAVGQHTDVSLDALKEVMTDAAFRIPSTGVHIFELQWHNSTNPNDNHYEQSYPNSFYIYNPFSQVKPRIHAFAVKKIS